MTRDLQSEVHAFLVAHGPATAAEIQRAVMARRADVTAALASPAFSRVGTPTGGNHRAKYFGASQAVPQRENESSQTARILAVLQQGGWWTTAEIHRLAGFSRLNSRVAEMRTRGYEIECERIQGVPAGPHAQAYRLCAEPKQAAA